MTTSSINYSRKLNLRRTRVIELEAEPTGTLVVSCLRLYQKKERRLDGRVLMVEDFKDPPTNLLTLKVPTQILQCPPCHQHYLLGKISALNLLDASKVQQIVSIAQDLAATGTGYFIVAELEILRVEVVNVFDFSNFIESAIESMISKASIDELVRRGSFVAGSKSQELDLGTCTICLEEFSSSPEAKLVRMDCSHVFHQACIYPWLENRSTTCPCCRRNINWLSCFIFFFFSLWVIILFYDINWLLMIWLFFSLYISLRFYEFYISWCCNS